jgi:excisionase family DNA binding protein
MRRANQTLALKHKDTKGAGVLPVTYMTPPAQHGYEPMVSGLDDVLVQMPLTGLPALIGELERLKTRALARLMNERETASTQDEVLLTMPEVARRLKISTYRAYELARQGIVKPVRIGKSVRLAATELRRYMIQRGH